MKVGGLLTVFAALTLCSAADAACYGSGSSYSCNDSNGNSYNVQRYGNTTTMQGSNPSTGSHWNQSSQTYGNTTYQHGTTNGQNWSQTIQTMPGTTTYSGTNSQGQPFRRTCTAAGCY